MTTLGIRVRKARRDKKLSQKALAERVGIKQQAIQRIERGDVKNTSYIVQLAHILEVSPDWLANGKEWQAPITYSSDFQGRYSPALITQAPLLSWSEVEMMHKQSCDNNGYFKVPVFNAPGGQCFTLQLQDDSMQHDEGEGISFSKGDYIFVSIDRKAQHNDFVIAKLVDSEQVIFRRYVKTKDHEFLTCLNSKYPTIAIDNDVEILGVVFMRYSVLTE